MQVLDKCPIDVSRDRRAGESLTQAVEFHREQRDPLSDVVVQFPRDPRPLLFVRVHQRLTEVRQQRLGTLVFRHVDCGRDVAGKRSVGRESRDASVENPPVLAVATPQPVLHPKRLALGERLPPGLEAALDVGRMHALRPAFAQLRLDRSAGE